MAQRIFRDDQGTEWTVIGVVPKASDRRAGEDRRRTVAPDVVVERRRAPDRRLRSRARALLTGGLEGGWLCFLAGDVRRRIAPIPSGWEGLSDRELAQLLARAVVVPPVPRRQAS